MLIVKEPKTEKEFSLYYDLRWRILRKPWRQPRGSEKDDKDDKGEKGVYHAIAFENENPEKPLGVGRIHLNSREDAQIRYMAVEHGWEGKGIGMLILKKLESHARKKWKVKRIILNARENAVGFYEKFGYKKVKKAHTLFGEILHYKMEKVLSLD